MPDVCFSMPPGPMNLLFASIHRPTERGTLATIVPEIGNLLGSTTDIAYVQIFVAHQK